MARIPINARDPSQKHRRNLPDHTITSFVLSRALLQLLPETQQNVLHPKRTSPVYLVATYLRRRASLSIGLLICDAYSGFFAVVGASFVSLLISTDNSPDAASPAGQVRRASGIVLGACTFQIPWNCVPWSEGAPRAEFPGHPIKCFACSVRVGALRFQSVSECLVESLRVPFGPVIALRGRLFLLEFLLYHMQPLQLAGMPRHLPCIMYQLLHLWMCSGNLLPEVTP